MIPFLSAPPRSTAPDKEKIEQLRHEAEMRNKAAGVKALSDVAWWLDEYGYRDDDPVDVVAREMLRTLFSNYAVMWKGSHAVVGLLAGKDDPTAGQIRKALK